jgi:hypothetical protein
MARDAQGHALVHHGDVSFGLHKQPTNLSVTFLRKKCDPYAVLAPYCAVRGPLHINTNEKSFYNMPLLQIQCFRLQAELHGSIHSSWSQCQQLPRLRQPIVGKALFINGHIFVVRTDYQAVGSSHEGNDGQHHAPSLKYTPLVHASWVKV